MSVDPRYAVLFEPVQIGPVTARNRFYQVPHCNGLGFTRPRAEAAMRGMKAEGGWAVVATQECEIHPTSDLAPGCEARLWDDRDIPALAAMAEAVHEHASLAAIELAHNGFHAANLLTRTPPLASNHMVTDSIQPLQARAMDLADIRALRRWHADAAKRALKAGFDIIYVYAGHHMTMPHHFLSPELNQRSDEYGGSLQNRVRLTRELLEDTREICDGRAAVAFRLAVDDMAGTGGMQAEEEGRAIVEMLAELPDLWDVNVAGWPNDSQTARFAPDEGYQEPYVSFVKQVTTKPVVGVGRYTSADRMAALIRKGVFDMIGAARPSIADPFLPAKIEEGRIDEIRECIGCNICAAMDWFSVPIRCTQNPTMGEEWRRGWHPEKIAPAASDAPVLVVGSGPAGLECALQLSNRGYSVTLAEAGRELGGRSRRESGLKGLGTWSRVRDYRATLLSQRADVEIFLESELTAEDILAFDFAHVYLATGARWRADGVGRSTRRAIPGLDGVAVLTPDDIMDGALPGDGPVLVWDDDRIYMGGVIADHLAAAGAEVALATPAPMVSPWTENTMEQGRIQAGLLAAGVGLRLSQRLVRIEAGEAVLACEYTGTETRLPCATLVTVTERAPERALYDALRAQDHGLTTLAAIGDALAPGLIADAVHAGHMAARNHERDPAEAEAELFTREMVSL